MEILGGPNSPVLRLRSWKRYITVAQAPLERSSFFTPRRTRRPSSSKSMLSSSASVTPCLTGLPFLRKPWEKSSPWAAAGAAGLAGSAAGFSTGVGFSGVSAIRPLLLQRAAARQVAPEGRAGARAKLRELHPHPRHHIPRGPH